MPRRPSFRRAPRSVPPTGGRQLFGFEPLEPREMLSGDGTYGASYRYDLANGGADTGVDSNETVLNPLNVGVGNFSKQFSVAVDGQVLAQPLYLANVNITGGASPGVHNVVFVATEHDSLYAIDADSGNVLWQDSFLGSFSVGGTGNTVTFSTVPSGDVNSGDISPEIGITGTPAIDTDTGFLYVVAKTKQVYSNDTADPHYVNTLYKIDIQDGSQSSTVIADTTHMAGGEYVYNSGPYVLGTGDGATTVGGQSRVYFNSLRQMFRPAVLLDNGQIYLGSASHGDNGPYHGWMLAYNETTLDLTGVLNATPNGGLGGLWQGDAPIAVDPQGFFYFETGNGSFNQSASNFPNGDTSQLPIDGDYGDSFVKVALDPTTTQTNQNVNGWGLKVVDYFTPQDQNSLNSADEDLGSGGPIVLPDSVGSTAHPHLLVGGGKEGKIYLLDRDNMGGFSPTDARAVQTQGSAVGGILSAPAYFNGAIYYTAGYGGGISAFAIANGAFSTTPVSTPDSFGNLDGGPVISADGSVNGIVWALERGSGQLSAYSAANLNDELYTSAQASNNSDAPGAIMKYTSPLVANGRVYVGTGNSLVVYGVPAPPTSPPAAPTALVATAPVGSEVTLSWTDKSNNEAEFDIERSSDDGATWTQVGTVGVNVSTYNDTTVQALATYSYRVRASNSLGASDYTNVASVTTPGVQSVGTGDGLLGQYYVGNSFVFSGQSPVLTRVDPTINFNWNSVGPDPSVGQTNYTVRWTGEVQAQYTEAYKFYTTSDDGIRVIVNGQTVIDDESYHAPTIDTSASINLIAGHSYAIEVDYFQGTGGAEAILNWSSPSTPQEVVPQSQLFSGSAPPAPVLLAPVAASGTQVDLAWTENSNIETGFEIQRKAAAGGTYQTIAIVQPSTTTLMDTGLDPATTYFYQVRALNFGSDSTWSNEVSLTTPVPPVTPSGAHPTRITPNEIDFAWTNNATDGTATRILRSPSSGGNFILVAILPPTTETFSDLGPNSAGLTPGNQYDYHIQVGNVAGYSDFTGFTVQTLTNPATQPIAVGASGQVTLTWIAPPGAASFNVYRSTTPGGEGATPIATNVADNWLVDSGLTNGTTYYYKITAVDTGGESAPSAQTSAMPQAASATPPPPGNLAVTAGDTRATLNWIAAAGATSYNIYRGTTSGDEVLVQSGVNVPTFVDTSLTDGTTYYYKVSSASALGEGSPATEVSVTPHPLAPPTPINVTATASDGQVSLSWTAASDALSYNLYRSTDEGDEVLYQQGVEGTSFIDTGVADGTTYYYQVSAANGVGESNLSIEVSATPLPPLPAAPASLVAAGINSAQIGLQWQESSTAVTSLELERSSDGVNFLPLTTLDPGVTSYIDSDALVPGTTYSYQLVATNLAGNSAASNIAQGSVSTQLAPPWADADIAAPSPAGAAYFYHNALTVSGSGNDIWNASDQFHFVYQTLNGDGTIIARVASQGNTDPWAKAGLMIRNTLDAGSAFADMVLTPGNGASFQWRPTAGGTPGDTATGGYTVPDWVELTRSGTTFTGYASTDGINWTQIGSTTISMNAQVYVGLADTSHDAGVISTDTFDSISINSSTGTPPVSPSGLQVQAASGTSASLTWSDTDTSQFGYLVYRQDPGSTTFTQIATLPSGATSFLDTGLTPGAGYAYQVVASNTVGNSAPSTTAVVNLPVVPIAPSILQFNQITTSSAGLSWQLNSSNDTGVYVYRRDGNASNFDLKATLPAGSQAYVDNSLAAGTLYEYHVMAFDAAGQSAFADTGLTTLTTAPTLVTATPGTAQVALSWAAPTGALAYNIYRGLSPGGEGSTPYASGIDATSFTDFGVNAGSTYYYRVTAVDFSGESSASQEALAAVSGGTAPSNTSLAVNGGEAQRSMVTSLTLGFSQPVTIDPSGVMITVPTGKTGTVPALNLSTTDGGLTYSITFSGPSVTGGSIADGVYHLAVVANAVTNGAGLHPSADVGLNFLRLYGDITGDGFVNNADLFQMRSAFTTTSGVPAFLAGLDYNSDGHIDNTDLMQFSPRFGQFLSLPGTTGGVSLPPLPADQDPINPDDVNASGQVTPIDALVVINALNANLGSFVAPATPTPNWFDVNGDGIVSPLDALDVIDQLNATAKAMAAIVATPSAVTPVALAAPAVLEGQVSTAAPASITTPPAGDSVSAVAETLASQAVVPAIASAAVAMPSPTAAQTTPAPVTKVQVPTGAQSTVNRAVDSSLDSDADDDGFDSLVELLASARVRPLD